MAKRVQQLLMERKDEIEAEVLRRVEEAKKVRGSYRPRVAIYTHCGISSSLSPSFSIVPASLDLVAYCS